MVGTTQSILISGTQIIQKKVEYASNNIASSTDPNFYAKSVNVSSRLFEGKGVGVGVDSVTRNINPFLQANFRVQVSEASYSKTVKEFNEKIEVILGTPNSTSNVKEKLQELINSYNLLVSRGPSMKQDTINKLQNMASELHDMSVKLFELKYEADTQFSYKIERFNNLNKELFELNKSISTTSGTNIDRTGYQDKIDQVVDNMAELMSIKITEQPNGSARIYTLNGAELLTQNLLEISYVPASSVNQLIEDTAINAVETYILDDKGNRNERINDILVTKGSEDNIQSYISKGELGALQYVRDVDIVNSIKQIDTFAAKLRDTLNSIHNNGTGFEPATSYVGDNYFSPNELRQFSGKFTVAVLDKDGNPVQRSDENKTDLRPLTLDLEKIDIGYGNGIFNYETLKNEINEYYSLDPIRPKTKIGNLFDLKIASNTNDVTANGNFSFDFELDNMSEVSSSFEILQVTVNDPLASVGTLPTGNFELKNGERSRTKQPINIDFSAAGGGPYLVNTQVKVTDGDGAISVATLEFEISPPQTGIINKRFVPNRVVSGAAYIEASSTNISFLEASIIDERGSESLIGGIGRFKLETSNSNYRLAILEQDSKDLGIPAINNSPGEEGTGRGLGHFLGLNNLIEDPHSSSSRLAAYNFKLREDIVNDVSKFSFGEIIIVNNNSREFKTVTKPVSSAMANIKFSANPEINDTLTINGRTITFVAAAASDSEVTIGASLQDSLNNLVAKLNAINPTTLGTIDAASYYVKNPTTLEIIHNSKGSNGNGMQISANFTNISASINEDLFSSAPNGSLKGGAEDVFNIFAPNYTYQVGEFNNLNAIKVLDSFSKTLNFSASGGLNAQSGRFIDYLAQLVNFRATESLDAKTKFEADNYSQEHIYRAIRQSAGVDINEQMANLSEYMQIMQAIGTSFNMYNKMFDLLIKAIAN